MPAAPQPHRILLADQVAEAIEWGIDNGTWKEWLPGERTMQTTLNVSRQTIRAALAHLVKTGTLSVHAYRGYKIARRTRRVKAGAGKREMQIGLICPEHVYRLPPRFVQMLDLLRGSCAKAGMELEILEGPRFLRADPARSLARVTRDRPKDCWILVLGNRATQEWFAASDVPAVVYGNVYPGLPLSCVGMHYRACIRHAAALLLGKGHRQIALVAYDLRRAGEQESLAGFQEAFASHRGDSAVPTVIERPDGDADMLCRQLDRALQMKTAPTAFIVSHTHHYATVATHLARRGCRVPEDVSLICRGEDPFLQFIRPQPTFYRANMELAARLLFNRVRQATSGGVQPDDQRLLIPELVAGHSVAAPPGAG